MPYPKFSFKDIPSDARIVFLDDGPTPPMYIKIWTITVLREHDITEELNLQGINYTSYADRSNGKIVYRFLSEEEYNIAKFLI